MHLLLSTLCPCLVAAASPSAAHADEDDDWHGDVVAKTDVPVDIGVQATLHTPYVFRATAGVGVTPGAYVSMINAFLVGVNAYSEETAELVAAAMSTSFALRVAPGAEIHVAERHLLYAEIGYRLVGFGGGATAAEIIEGATGQSLPEDAAETRTFKSTAALHMLDVRLGWEVEPVDHFVIHTALGGVFTLGASTTIEPEYTPRAPRAADGVAAAASAYLDDVFTSYVFSPYVSVGLGARF